MIIELITQVEKFFLSGMGIAIIILAIMLWQKFTPSNRNVAGAFIIAGILGFIWKFILLVLEESELVASIAETSEALFMIFTLAATLSWLFMLQKVAGVSKA